MLALEPLSSRKRTVTDLRGLTPATAEDVEEERARGGEKTEERCGGDEADAKAEHGGARSAREPGQLREGVRYDADAADAGRAAAKRGGARGGIAKR